MITAYFLGAPKTQEQTTLKHPIKIEYVLSDKRDIRKEANEKRKKLKEEDEKGVGFRIY